jgi:hypothetical protein
MPRGVPAGGFGRNWTDVRFAKPSEMADDPRIENATTTYAGYVQRVVLKVMRDHQRAGDLPTSNRFVLYELEQQGLAMKSAPNGNRYSTQNDGPAEANVISAMSDLRKQGVIPWEWIVDETRTLHQWSYSETVADYVRESLADATINPWSGEPPLILIEDRATAGVLRQTAGRYVVPIAATNGYVGGFLRTNIAPLLADNDREVLWLGDHDEHGYRIESSSRRDLEDETGRVVEWRRVAVTAGLAKVHKVKPVIKEGKKAWELESLGQGTLQAILRDALDDLLPEPLEDVLAREQEQREEIEEILDEHLPE